MGKRYLLQADLNRLIFYLIRISERYYSVPIKSPKLFLVLVLERHFLLSKLLFSENLAFYRVGKMTLEKSTLN